MYNFAQNWEKTFKIYFLNPIFLFCFICLGTQRMGLSKRQALAVGKEDRTLILGAPSAAEHTHRRLMQNTCNQDGQQVDLGKYFTIAPAPHHFVSCAPRHTNPCNSHHVAPRLKDPEVLDHSHSIRSCNEQKWIIGNDALKMESQWAEKSPVPELVSPVLPMVVAGLPSLLPINAETPMI